MGIFVLRLKKEAAGVAIAGAPPHFTYYKARLDAITVEVEHQADMFEKIILGKRENIINSPETTHNLSMQIYIYIFILHNTPSSITYSHTFPNNFTLFGFSQFLQPIMRFTMIHFPQQINFGMNLQKITNHLFTKISINLELHQYWANTKILAKVRSFAVMIAPTLSERSNFPNIMHHLTKIIQKTS